MENKEVIKYITVWGILNLLFTGLMGATILEGINFILYFQTGLKILVIKGIIFGVLEFVLSVLLIIFLWKVNIK